MSRGCEVNVAGREEDCGRHIAYHPCGKTPTWTVDTGRQEFQACEKHSLEVLRDSDVATVTDAAGDPIKQCACGAVFTHDEFQSLELCGEMDDGDGGTLELRQCRCSSTISVQVAA